MLPTLEELRLTIDESEWVWLRPHLERDSLVVVDSGLELADVALKLAADDTDCFQRWIVEGRIGKPTEEQVHQWNGDQHKRFSMLIVSPFVLIQDRQPAIH